MSRSNSRARESLCYSLRAVDSKENNADVDSRLIPICGLMYCVSLLDRTNLSNAAIAGMTKELALRAPGPDRYVRLSPGFPAS